MYGVIKGCIIPPFHWDNRHFNSHGRMHCMLLLRQVGFTWLHQVFYQKSYSYDYVYKYLMNMKLVVMKMLCLYKDNFCYKMFSSEASVIVSRK